MRRGGRILIILGLFLGAITAVGTFWVLKDAEGSGGKVETQPVVVALQRIPDRSIIPPAALGVREWPVTVPLPGVVFTNTKSVEGKLAMQPIFPGQLILPEMIIDKEKAGEIKSGSIASFVIPTGTVAIAFSITEITGVGNALQPGDRVDMLLTLQSSGLPFCPPAKPCSGTEGLPVTQMMLQDVLILQVGPWTSGGDQGKGGGQASVITFALDRQDALTLKSAREQGQIDLALRGVNDRARFDNLEPVNLQYLNRRFKFNLTPASTGTGR